METYKIFQKDGNHKMLYKDKNPPEGLKIKTSNRRMGNHNFRKEKMYQSDGMSSRRWEIIQNDGYYFVNLFRIIIIIYFLL